MAAVSTSAKACPCLSSQRARTYLPSRPFTSQRAVLVRAAADAPSSQQVVVKPPSGVSSPAQEPKVPPPAFGWVDNAERLNSRAAMVGFVALLIIEGVSHKALLELFGFTIGNGLGFEL